MNNLRPTRFAHYATDSTVGLFLFKRYDMSHKIKSMIGKRFGALVVTGKAKKHNGRSQAMCKCDCGNPKAVYPHHLESGDTKSCGCGIHNKNKPNYSGRKLISVNAHRSAKGGDITVHIVAIVSPDQFDDIVKEFQDN